MKIAMIISNLISVPPVAEKMPKSASGAPEMISWQLAEQLVKHGHAVTLFAASGSNFSGKIVSVGSKATAELSCLNVQDRINYEYWLITEAIKHDQQGEFDVIHSQLPERTAAIASLFKSPVLTTLHSPVKAEDELLKANAKSQYFVSISNAQRKPLPGLNYLQTIYHGIDVSRYDFNENPKNDLVFVGRIVSDKGPDIAIEVANNLALKLDIFGEHPTAEERFYQEKIRPRVKGSINLHGFTDQPQVIENLRQSKALLFPLRWEEPFGLVMIEAMATGTPVIAFNRGSVSEIIKDGETGFIIEPDNISDFQDAVKNIINMPNSEYQAMRRACRKHIEQNFSIEKMTSQYEQAYQKIANHRGKEANLWQKLFS